MVKATTVTLSLHVIVTWEVKWLLAFMAFTQHIAMHPRE